MSDQQSDYLIKSTTNNYQSSRRQLLKKRFARRYPHLRITNIVRAPGRINLIGEHTDYNGYPVLPIAIDRDILMAFSSLEKSKVLVSNVNQNFFDREFIISGDISPGPTGDWGNYVKAAVVGLVSEYPGFPTSAKGVAAMFLGDIPPAAGLSSSSAMVVASAVAVLAANGLEIKHLLLAEILARAERFVGTEGGGMDQATSLMGRENSALKLDFFPLRVKPVPLPKGYAFVIAHSLVHAPKTESARLQYNRRPIECRLATALLAAEIDRVSGKKFPATRLADLSTAKTGFEQKELDEMAGTAFSEVSSLKEISRRLGTSEHDVAQNYCKMRDGSLFPEPADGFKLWRRYRHVVTEAERVKQAASALASDDMDYFGELMNASHKSCRDDYEISCPELDALVEIARENGAIGARLTGAGFGGCAICLVKEKEQTSFIQRLHRDYYRAYLAKTRPELMDCGRDLDQVVFACRACDGADLLDKRV